MTCDWLDYGTLWFLFAVILSLLVIDVWLGNRLNAAGQKLADTSVLLRQAAEEIRQLEAKQYHPINMTTGRAVDPKDMAPEERAALRAALTRALEDLKRWDTLH